MTFEDEVTGSEWEKEDGIDFERNAFEAFDDEPNL